MFAAERDGTAPLSAECAIVVAGTGVDKAVRNEILSAINYVGCVERKRER